MIGGVNMITYEEAVATVRKEMPDLPIRTVFEYNGEYHFSVSSGRTFIPDDSACTHAVVNKSNGKLRYETIGNILFGFKTKQETLEYKEASSNMKPVDITTDQFEELKSTTTI
jgi:hypothetical protein